MDADRVRSYLQVACSGLGFDIGEVWWMNSESGASTVATIREANGHESDSSGEDAYSHLVAPKGSPPQKQKKTPKKRFLQLYTSKAYGGHRSKLVQPHDLPPGSPGSSSPDASPAASDANALTIRRTTSSASLELDKEHVLSPRIVEAVTHSTQVVWANCQKTEGLLGRSDIKLQTAIGMPVGVDETGNVWVVVMFSPKNVESCPDAIDYLQYISRSAASTSIPCLLPVVGDASPRPGAAGNGLQGSGTKMICDGDAGSSSSSNNNPNDSANDESNRNSRSRSNSTNSDDSHHGHSLVSIKPTKRPEHVEELGNGVMAKFVSFKIHDDDDDDEKCPGGELGQYNGGTGARNQGNQVSRRPSNDLRHAPKDDWGIPMLPDHSDAIDSAITDTFDEASYGVWSTIMNSAGGGDGAGERPPPSSAHPPSSRLASRVSRVDRSAEGLARASEMRTIQERLEEFAAAFLGMSVFDVADAWTADPSGDGGAAAAGGEPSLRCLFTVAATETSPEINALRRASAGACVRSGDGAVGKAYGSGYPVWSSVKDLIYDAGRRSVLRDCKIETAFAVPIFSAGDPSPSCVLSCYSLLPAESVPFVLNFVQKAVRLLWGGLDRVVNPHESVGRDLWRDVGPADLGEMAADVEMQKAFIGMKRPRSTNNLVGSAAGGEEEKRRHVADGGTDYGKCNNGIGSREESYSFQEQEEYVESDGRDRGNSLVAQMSALPGAPLQRPVATTMTTPFEESKVEDNHNYTDGMSAPPGAAAQQQAIVVAEPMATAPTTTVTAMQFEESNHNYNNDGIIMAEATSHSFPQEDYDRGRGNSLVAQLAVLPGAAGQQRFIAMAEPTTTVTTTTAAATMSEESKVEDSNNYNNNNDDGSIMAETTMISCPEEEYGGGRDQGKSLVAQLGVLPSPAPVTAAYSQPVAPTAAAEEPMAAPQVPERATGVSINAPPAKGLAPAPILPHTVQGRPPDAQQFLFLDAGRDGHWAVQRAVTSLEDARLWNRAENSKVNGAGADSGQVNNNLQGQYQNYLAAPGRQHNQQQHPPPTPSQPLHQEQPPKYQMSYVNYQPENAAVQQPQQQQEHQPPVAVAMPYPPMGAHKDDPATIHANLMEFNAMARMHISNSNGNQPQHGSNLDGLQPQHAAAAPALAATPVAPDGGLIRAFDALNGTCMKVPPPPPTLPPPPPTLNGHPQAAPSGGGINLERMVVIPISQSKGSIILTGPQQQMMYCTTSASAASQQLPGMGGTEGLRPIDPSLFALADRKPCRIEGCSDLAVAKRPYCEKHCGNRQCEREGCTKCAQGATRFCIAHGGGRRCTFPGCDKGARDKYFCAAHGGGKRCKREGCNKSAVGGSQFCTGHGGGKRCQVPGCNKSAQSSTKFCVKHGGGKKCQHPGCEKVARGRTLFCAAHGGGVRCKLEGCNRVAIGKAQLCRAHGGGAHSRFNAAAI